MPIKDPIKRKEKDRQYRLRNVDKIKHYQQQYKLTEKYKSIRKKITEKYRKNNKHKIKESNRKYNLKPDVRMRIILRKRLQMALKYHGGKNHTKSIDLIGCSYKECREYLERQFKPGMSWSNYGKNGWHIDHIRPCASFDLTDPNQQKLCFHYTNLQPLWAEENLKKGCKFTTSPASHDGCGRSDASPDDPCGCGWNEAAPNHGSSCEGSGRR